MDWMSVLSTLVWTLQVLLADVRACRGKTCRTLLTDTEGSIMYVCLICHLYLQTLNAFFLYNLTVLHNQLVVMNKAWTLGNARSFPKWNGTRQCIEVHRVTRSSGFVCLLQTTQDWPSLPQAQKILSPLMLMGIPVNNTLKPLEYQVIVPFWKSSISKQ